MPRRSLPKYAAHLWVKEVIEDIIYYSHHELLPKTEEGLRGLLDIVVEELGIPPENTSDKKVHTAKVINLMNRRMKITCSRRGAKLNWLD
jgi:rRNA pseudouridine-1189 N-methylase Emg1 (Nep1/Mra1 family)